MEGEFFAGDFVARASFLQREFDRWNAARTLRRLSRFARPGRLLEIGAGYGVFLAEATRLGFQCTALELSQDVAARLRGAGHRVVQGCLEDFAPGSPFKVVVMNHVLEHMPDPAASLRRLHGILLPAGILHIAVPNVEAWDARLRGWTSYQPYHLFYYSAATLTRLLEQCGFEIVLVQTVEPFSGWLNAILRSMLDGRFSRVRGSARGHGGGSSWRGVLRTGLNLARLLAGVVTWPLRVLQGACGRGEELVIIARRPADAIGAAS